MRFEGFEESIGLEKLLGFRSIFQHAFILGIGHEGRGECQSDMIEMKSICILLIIVAIHISLSIRYSVRCALI